MFSTANLWHWPWPKCHILVMVKMPWPKCHGINSHKHQPFTEDVQFHFNSCASTQAHATLSFLEDLLIPPTTKSLTQQCRRKTGQRMQHKTCQCVRQGSCSSISPVICCLQHYCRLNFCVVCQRGPQRWDAQIMRLSAIVAEVVLGDGCYIPQVQRFGIIYLHLNIKK